MPGRSKGNYGFDVAGLFTSPVLIIYPGSDNLDMIKSIEMKMTVHIFMDTLNRSRYNLQKYKYSGIYGTIQKRSGRSALYSECLIFKGRVSEKNQLVPVSSL